MHAVHADDEGVGHPAQDYNSEYLPHVARQAGMV